MLGAATYRDRWEHWVKDPLIAKVGLTFDRTPAGRIAAPSGKIRVCAWHMDFDERPTCFLDVDDAGEARFVCANLVACCGWNVDFATAHDEAGVALVARPY